MSLGVDSLRGGLAEGNGILIWLFLVHKLLDFWVPGPPPPPTHPPKENSGNPSQAVLTKVVTLRLCGQTVPMAYLVGRLLWTASLLRCPSLPLSPLPLLPLDVCSGGEAAACITATTLAMVDAGIPMRDFLVACTAGYIDEVPLIGMAGAPSGRSGITPSLLLVRAEGAPLGTAPKLPPSGRRYPSNYFRLASNRRRLRPNRRRSLPEDD